MYHRLKAFLPTSKTLKFKKCMIDSKVSMSIVSESMNGHAKIKFYCSSRIGALTTTSERQALLNRSRNNHEPKITLESIMEDN